MAVLQGRHFISQPFRPGATNPGDYRRYLAMRFPDGSGIVQVGYDFDRLMRAVPHWDAEMLHGWRIGRSGYYDLCDRDRDGRCNYGDSRIGDGMTERIGDEFIHPFTFAGTRFVAILPVQESFEQRNTDFMILAPSLSVVMLFFAFFVRSLLRASEADRKRHASEAAIRARDLQVARTIQLSSLPHSERLWQECLSFTLATSITTAKEVGGDFYDFRFLDKSHLVLAIADVSGKGIPSALFMMRARDEIASAVGSLRDLGAAIRQVNERLCANNEAEMFVTAWVGVLDIRSGELEYVNAGHTRPFVRGADGTVRRLDGKGGCLLGLFLGTTYRVESLSLSPGESLFLSTDGITEARDGNRGFFGEKRLSAALAEGPADPRGMIAAVSEAVRRYSEAAEQSDDMTTLALQWHGAPESRTRTFVVGENAYRPVKGWLRETCALTDRIAQARMLTAADEVVANIVRHSDASAFQVSVQSAPGRVHLVFKDDGIPFNPLSHVDPDTNRPLSERPQGGLGVLMVKNLTEALTYRREDSWNILEFTVCESFDRSGKDAEQCSR